MKPISAIFVLLAVLICLCPAFADTLTLPASLTVIEEEAFYGDTSLSSVVLPEGLKEIKAGAFASSTISAINLPSTLESIDDTALPAPGTIQVTAEKGTWSYGWAVEKGYIVPEASSLDDFVIENGVVTQYVGAGGDVVIPSKDRDGNDVVGIGNHSFFECTNVTSEVIPNSVT